MPDLIMTTNAALVAAFAFEAHASDSETSFAGWSSPVARQAHNLKVVSSNLAPATKFRV
jgi:hypothetical protein